jgi:hypothetical protein
MLRIKIRIRAAHAVHPSKSDQFRVRRAHESLTNDIYAMFVVKLGDVWLCEFLFREDGEEMRVFGEMMIFPECLETVQLVRAFEVGYVALEERYFSNVKCG